MSVGEAAPQKRAMALGPRHSITIRDDALGRVIEKGYVQSDCKKFRGGSFYRVFKQVWR